MSTDSSNSSNSTASEPKKPGFFSKISWVKMTIFVVVGAVILWILCCIGKALAVFFGKNGGFSKITDLGIDIFGDAVDNCTDQGFCSEVGKIPNGQDTPLLDAKTYEDQCTKNTKGCNFSFNTLPDGTKDSKSGFCMQRDPTRTPGQTDLSKCIETPFLLILTLVGSAPIILGLLKLFVSWRNSGKSESEKISVSSPATDLNARLNNQTQAEALFDLNNFVSVIEAKNKNEASKWSITNPSGKDTRTELLKSYQKQNSITIAKNIILTASVNATDAQKQESIVNSKNQIKQNQEFFIKLIELQETDDKKREEQIREAKDIADRAILDIK